MTLKNSAWLSEYEKGQFEREGYLFPVRVLSQSETDGHLASFMDYFWNNQERLADLAPRDKYKVLAETHLVYPWVFEIVSHRKVLDAVESLLGPNLLVWATDWFVKMPGEKSYVSMHQDGTYWNLRPPNVITAWVALSPSTSANGGLRVIPGTHQQPAMPQRETYAADNVLSRGQEIAVEMDESTAVDVELQPGEMSLHHIWLVHGSNPNNSPVPRIGLAIRFVTPDVVQESPQRPLAILVRGRDDYGNFELAKPPIENDGSPEAHEEFIHRVHSSVMISPQKKGNG